MFRGRAMSSRFMIRGWRVLWVACLLILIPVILFQLRWLAFPGGDSGEMVNRLKFPWQFFMRAPLVILLNKTLWVFLSQRDWPPEDCIALPTPWPVGCTCSPCGC